MRRDMARVLGERRHKTRRGPAHRFLVSNVGRPWDKLYAEICDRCRGKNHLREDFVRLVHRHVVLEDGKPIRTREHFRQAELRPGELYVCPKTGLLRRVKEVDTSRKQRQADGYVRLDELHQARKIDGAWHMVTLRRLPGKTVGARGNDVVLNIPVSQLNAERAVKTYGAPLYAVAASKMTTEQLEQYKIAQ